MQAKERASTPYSSVVFYLDSHLSPSKSSERISVHRIIEQMWKVDIKNQVKIVQLLKASISKT
jgi:hypothetical protein